MALYFLRSDQTTAVAVSQDLTDTWHKPGDANAMLRWLRATFVVAPQSKQACMPCVCLEIHACMKPARTLTSETSVNAVQKRRSCQHLVTRESCVQARNMILKRIASSPEAAMLLRFDWLENFVNEMPEGPGKQAWRLLAEKYKVISSCLPRAHSLWCQR
jgi:hypothetical protein